VPRNRRTQNQNQIYSPEQYTRKRCRPISAEGLPDATACLEVTRGLCPEICDRQFAA
jgi:hypothetical protein